MATSPSNLTDDEARILAAGPASPSDYEIVGRLIDYGYTDSHCVISKRRESFGHVTSVYWAGANSSGRLALEQRLLGAIRKDSDFGENVHDGNHAKSNEKSIPKSLGSFFAKIAHDSLVQVLAGLLSVAIGILLFRHFGFSIK